MVEGVHAGQAGCFHIPRRVIDVQYFFRRKADRADDVGEDLLGGLEHLEILGNEDAAESRLQVDAGLPGIFVRLFHRDGAVVGQDVEGIALRKLPQQCGRSGFDGVQQGVEAAADVRVRDARAAVFPAFFEEFRHADAAGLQVADHPPLMAGVQELFDPVETRGFLEGADAAVLVQGDQDAAQVKYDGLDHACTKIQIFPIFAVTYALVVEW